MGKKDVYNLGYVLAESYWDNGYMTEALENVLKANEKFINYYLTEYRINVIIET